MNTRGQYMQKSLYFEFLSDSPCCTIPSLIFQSCFVVFILPNVYRYGKCIVVVVFFYLSLELLQRERQLWSPIFVLVSFLSPRQPFRFSFYFTTADVKCHVAAIKCLPVLYHIIDYILISSRIIQPILITLKIEYCLSWY